MSRTSAHKSNGNAESCDSSPALPNGWCWTTLDEIALIGTGSTPSRTNAGYWTGGNIAWITSSAVNRPFVHAADEFVTASAVAAARLKMYPVHTLILALYGEGKTRGKVSELLIPATINQALAALQLQEPVAGCRPFVKAFLESNYIRMRQQAAGGMQPNLNLGLVKKVEVPFAPLNEQRRIVAKIEELFSDLDAGVATLELAKANLKRYRAAVLKAAVEGRLTAAWRAAHSDIEPASKLLHRILADRRRQWEQDQLAKFTVANKLPPKNWQAKYAKPTVDSLQKKASNAGWTTSRLDEVSEIIDCLHKTPTYWDSGFPMVRVTDVKGGILDLSNALHVTEEVYLEFTRRHRPRQGDIVFSRVGTYGNVSIVNNDLPFCIGQNTAIIIPAIDARYLHYCLQSPPTRRLIDKAVVGSTYQTISLKSMGELLLPIPPLVEQEVIVREVAEKLSQIEAAETAIDHSLARAARLRQSILKRAFSGQLVPQDPQDEPASAMLERLQSGCSFHEGNGNSGQTGGMAVKKRRI